MAVSNFPYHFTLGDGSTALVTQVGKDGFSFDFVATDRNGVTESFNWTPSKDEVRLNKVRKKREYSNLQYQAIATFWAIYND